MNNCDKMKIAYNLAKEALEKGEMPIAAVIFKDDDIVTKAYTSEFNDERFLVHAELKALMEVDKQKYSYADRRKMKMFVTLEPCMMCLGASLSFFLGEIHYAVDAPIDGAIGFIDEIKHRTSNDPGYAIPKTFSGMLKEECIELFHDYIKVAPNEGLRNFAKGILAVT